MKKIVIIMLKHMSALLFAFIAFIDFALIFGESDSIYYNTLEWALIKISGFAGGFVLYKLGGYMMKNRIFPDWIVEDFNDSIKEEV